MSFLLAEGGKCLMKRMLAKKLLTFVVGCSSLATAVRVGGRQLEKKADRPESVKNTSNQINRVGLSNRSPLPPTPQQIQSEVCSIVWRHLFLSVFFPTFAQSPGRLREQQMDQRHLGSR